jgi:hypothetical protein
MKPIVFIVAATTVSSGCSLGYRAKFSKNQDGLVHDLSTTVWAPIKSVAVGVNYGQKGAGVGAGYIFGRGDKTTYTPYAAYRFDQSKSKSLSDAGKGVEVGLHIRRNYLFSVEAGAQKTFGTDGDTVVFAGVGFDLGLGLIALLGSADGPIPPFIPMGMRDKTDDWSRERADAVTLFRESQTRTSAADEH